VLEGKAIIERSIETLTETIGRNCNKHEYAREILLFRLPSSDIQGEKAPIIGYCLSAATGEDSGFFVLPAICRLSVENSYGTW